MSTIREINPLAVHGLRRMAHCPPHFEAVLFDIATEEQDILDWIHVHCAGRFFFGDSFTTNLSGQIGMCKKAAFETHSEASYFGLLLADINQPKNFVF